MLKSRIAKWIRDLKIKWQIDQDILKRKWEVHIYMDGSLLLLMPNPLKDTSENWDRWGIILADILSQIEEKWSNPHTYLYVYTDEAPMSFYDNLIKGRNYLELNYEKHDIYVYLFTDCQDKLLWQNVLDSRQNSVFVFNQILENPDTIIENVLNSKDFESPKLSLLATSDDSDFHIQKIEMTEQELLSILENVAQKENWYLIIHRKNKYR